MMTPFVRTMLLALAATGTAYGATFDVSPSSVCAQCENWSPIIFNIDGVTPGQTVIVEKFLDGNTNGMVDGDDLLLMGWPLKDGHLTTVGGVRNLNVAGDDDHAVNGQIVSAYFYPGVSFILDEMAGAFLYRLSDPTGHFAPLVRPFEVQPEVGAGVTGTVTETGTGEPIASAVVALISARHGAYLAATDGDGRYTIYAPPDTYPGITVIKPGYVGGSGEVVVRDSTTTLAQRDLTLRRTNFTISGRVTDRETGAAIQGMAVMAGQDASTDVAFGVTDATGGYQLYVTGGTWRLSQISEEPPRFGYIRAGQQEVHVAGNLSNVNLQLEAATALIFGTLTADDHTGVWPVLNFDVVASPVGCEGEDCDGYLGHTVATCGDHFCGPLDEPVASYSVGVRPGSWSVGPSSEDPRFGNYRLEYTNVTLAAAEAERADFVMKEIAAACVGDCNSDGKVLINELISAVNIALDRSDVTACPAGDENGDKRITIEELITAVNHALSGC